MFCLSGLLFLYGRRNAVIVLQALQVEFRNLLRRAASEDDPRAQAFQAALADEVDGSEGITTQLIEVVMDPHY